jgi:pimeloyl-ACP methyl ester carboxylesterase
MELIRLQTRDEVELHGLLHPPIAGSMAAPSAPDAAVFLHGAGGNFYSAALLAAVMPPLLQSGTAVLAINTRGHDLVCTLRTPQGGRRGGAAYEVIDECRHDVHAAVDLLVGRGYRRIALIGHSLGALKAVYAQACQPHPSVEVVIAISPPRFSYHAFCNGPRGEQFLTAMREAEQHISAGKPLRLIEVTVPLPLLITAAGYIDKYGPQERYDLLKFAGGVACRSLYFFGQNELNSTHPAFAGLDEAMRQLAIQTAANITVQVIDGADHFYVGRHAELATAMIRLIASPT